jgi:hypothetical protein
MIVIATPPADPSQTLRLSARDFDVEEGSCESLFSAAFNVLETSDAAIRCLKGLTLKNKFVVWGIIEATNQNSKRFDFFYTFCHFSKGKLVGNRKVVPEWTKQKEEISGKRNPSHCASPIAHGFKDDTKEGFC